jgi:peptidoglycan hydrolase CwlO-like protein
MENNDLQEILKQLQQLQLQQTNLTAKLAATIAATQATPPEVTNKGTSELKPEAKKKASAKQQRVLNVGDKVQIRNPRPNQENRGTIVKIGASNITVQTATGTKIIRAPHNLSLVK